MGTELGAQAVFGIGLSVIFGFARWRYPAVPHKIADGGLLAGIVLLVLGITMPNIHMTPAAIIFFVMGCLCFGAAAHFATREDKLVQPSSREPSNAMGPITNNSGINTQGQRGNNVIGGK